jgi:hypothetical protein
VVPFQVNLLQLNRKKKLLRIVQDILLKGSFIRYAQLSKPHKIIFIKPILPATEIELFQKKVIKW